MIWWVIETIANNEIPRCGGDIFASQQQLAMHFLASLGC
ncbi:hypothetical protein yaldo0001_11860 [Yersinia aldovae ATCC 35236]|nr:hypothetical protein yaldo0001_11860 [Yersinia aldovae ATCC 35236]